MEVSTIISLVLTVVATIAGGFWLKAKGKLAQVKTLVKEAVDIVTVAVDALEDNAVSNEEIDNLKLQVTEFKAALKALLGKV
jgi:hypothetical protein